ncbi:glycerol-3-phosphate O-acyltransferase [Myxococcaceae bacterium]|jgi:glycerol-3-phosphate O-acyltransferase|nr:glycerol-3-phosphate O-acyltransferase [Myxococcaceae bacterium]
MPLRPHVEEPGWPRLEGAPPRTIFLLDASSPLERRLLEGWIERQRPAGATDVETAEIPPSRRSRRRPDPRLEAALASPDDALLAPLRVIWRPALRNGVRAVRLRDLLTFGDPRDPGLLRQHWLVRRHADRCWIVAGEPALASELRSRWRAATDTDRTATQGLADFVAHQAGLSLERAERRLRGQQYKVPRLVHRDILGRASFRSGVARLARELGRSEESVRREAARNLREIAATHSPYVIDLAARLIRLLYTRGYSETLHYDRDQLRQLYALAQRYPVVFLPSHKSNLDHLVLQYALFENGLPPNHTAGGINMNFFPVGPLVRRSGVFFIRRTFKDQPIYKFVLRSYVDYLIEKRFSLEWYVEGGRSRSGKLLPPRLGLMTYVVDAFLRGKSDDVFLLPVSIAYDQITDVGDYAAEQRGAGKERESFRWFVRIVRRLSGRYGAIHLRFGEPLSLVKALGHGARPDETREEENLEVQKLAFEACVRINRATPITPTSLVTLALLGRGDRALDIETVVDSLRNLLHYVDQRKLPTTSDLQLDTTECVRRVLDELVTSGVVTCYAEGPEAVYAIGADQHLAAAYYRNTIIHFFVNGAIAELALLRASEEDDDRAASFWEAAFRLRDLLKFEFFFADKEAFRDEVRQEIAVHDGEWEWRPSDGGGEVLALLRKFRPFLAHRVLRPFIEAYRVVADTLERVPAGQSIDPGEFLAACQARGRQYLLQRRSRSAESVSKVLYEAGLRLARNRRLVESDSPDLAERRAAFAAEVREWLRRIDAIDAMAAARIAGLQQ